jgi:hypothetical protein
MLHQIQNKLHRPFFKLQNYPGLEGHLNGTKGKTNWKRLHKNHGVASVPITVVTRHNSLSAHMMLVQHFESVELQKKKLRK